MSEPKKSSRKQSVMTWALASKIGPGFRRDDKGPLTWRTREECRRAGTWFPNHKPVRVRVTVEEVSA